MLREKRTNAGKPAKRLGDSSSEDRRRKRPISMGKTLALPVPPKGILSASGNQTASTGQVNKSSPVDKTLGKLNDVNGKNKQKRRDDKTSPLARIDLNTLGTYDPDPTKRTNNSSSGLKNGTSRNVEQTERVKSPSSVLERDAVNYSNGDVTRLAISNSLSEPQTGKPNNTKSTRKHNKSSSRHLLSDAIDEIDEDLNTSSGMYENEENNNSGATDSESSDEDGSQPEGGSQSEDGSESEDGSQPEDMESRSETDDEIAEDVPAAVARESSQPISSSNRSLALPEHSKGALMPRTKNKFVRTRNWAFPNGARVTVDVADVLLDIRKLFRSLNSRLTGLETFIAEHFGAGRGNQDDSVDVDRLFPLDSTFKFDDLEERIMSDTKIREALIYQLSLYASADGPKSAYDLVKKCLSRDLALRFVFQSSRSKKERKFKPTQLCSVIIQAVRRRDKNSRNKDITDSISLALTRAVDWDNGRAKRRQPSDGQEEGTGNTDEQQPNEHGNPAKKKQKRLHK